MIVLHVLTALLFLGPVTVATSSFHVRAAEANTGDTHAAGAAKTLYNITQNYGVLSLLVPLLGVAIMFLDISYYFTQYNFHAAIVLAIAAWAVLLFLIIPRQKKMMGSLGLLDAADHDPETDTLADGEWVKTKKQLSMFGGIFSLLWLIMFVLMYV